MEKKKTIGVLALSLFAVFAIAGLVAAQGFGVGNFQNVNAVDRIAVEQAVENGDYEAWTSLHEGMNGKMAELINEDNFHLLTEMHEAREAGDFDKVKEIKEELRFPAGMGNGKAYANGFRQGFRNGFQMGNHEGCRMVE